MKLKRILTELAKPSFTKIKVYRGFFSDSIEDIDLNEIGCHWSVDEQVANDIENSVLSTKQGNELFVVTTWINLVDINFMATMESSKAHPREFEIVIEPNTDILINIQDNYGETVVNSIRANTGNRYDSWVDDARGFTIEDFYNKINEYAEWADVK